MDTSQTQIGDFLTETEDWTFRGVDTKQYTHGLHSYPARMIPQITEKLIMDNSDDDELIWDPFCGSGSTLVESMLNHRMSIGTDLNPFAVFLAKVKTTPLRIDILEKRNNEIQTRLNDLKQEEAVLDIPDLHNIGYWFSKEAQDGLASIKASIEPIRNSDIKNFFLLCMALSVRESSYLKKNEFKIVRISKEKVDKYEANPEESFFKYVKRNIQLMSNFEARLKEDYYSPEIYEVDNRHVENTMIADDSVDLVVTSPPYGDHGTTVAYGQFSRYPALWIGLDRDAVKTVDRRGLGGRRKKENEYEKLPSAAFRDVYERIRDKRENLKRANECYSFFVDLRCSLQSIHDKLRRKSQACIVIGNRLMSRERIPTNRIIIEFGEAIGFSHFKTIPRDIPTKRMPWQNAPENITGEKADTMHTEHIVILRKK